MSRPSRYELIARLASGGMGTVYVGRVRGPLGFSRLVAIKRAHPHLMGDPTFVSMLLGEPSWPRASTTRTWSRCSTSSA